MKTVSWIPAVLVICAACWAQTVEWTHDHIEYGMSHAAAAAPDWVDPGRILARDEAEVLTSAYGPLSLLLRAIRRS